jgi:ketosteroid isomerase-like protein
MEVYVAEFIVGRRLVTLGVVAVSALFGGATLRAGTLAVGRSPDSQSAAQTTRADTGRRGDVEDSAAVAHTVKRFHQALAAGDSAAVLALLTPDATILESGDSETVAEYRSHHLPADIEFARAVKEARTPIRATVRGDAAWAVSTSSTRGEFKGRAVNAAGAELVVLTRTPDGWRIAAIHWSSRRRTT